MITEIRTLKSNGKFISHSRQDKEDIYSFIHYTAFSSLSPSYFLHREVLYLIFRLHHHVFSIIFFGNGRYRINLGLGLKRR